MPSRGFGRVRRLAINLCLAFICFLFALLIAEGILRVAGQRILGEGEYIAVGTVFKVPDPLLGFSLVPGSSRLVARGGAFVMKETISSQGLRDIEHAVVKSPGRSRILVLGDSFMYGDGVAMEATMPRRLATLMEDVEVINGGVRAYDLGQEYLFYRHRARLFKPDLVLLAFFINDLAPDPTQIALDGPDGLPSAYETKPDELALQRARTRPGLKGLLSSWLNSRSMLYVLVRKRIDGLVVHHHTADSGERRNNAAGIFYLSAFHSETSDGSTPEEWRRAYRILDELKRNCSEDGARLAVILIPAPWQLSENFWRNWVEWLGVEPASLSRRRPQQMMLNWCSNSDTPCLDLLEEWQEQDRHLLYFRADHHWTPEGHERSASAVQKFLVAEGMP